jgi:hypothetical protein
MQSDAKNMRADEAVMFTFTSASEEALVPQQPIIAFLTILVPTHRPPLPQKPNTPFVT